MSQVSPPPRRPSGRAPLAGVPGGRAAAARRALRRLAAQPAGGAGRGGAGRRALRRLQRLLSHLALHPRAPRGARGAGAIPRALLFPAPGLPPGNLVMGYDETGCCPMLVCSRCTIYEHRPTACRTYDCRIYAAAGVSADRADIAAQVARWRFSYPGARGPRPARRRARRGALHPGASGLSGRPGRAPRPAAPCRAAVAVHAEFLPRTCRQPCAAVRRARRGACRHRRPRAAVRRPRQGRCRAPCRRGRPRPQRKGGEEEARGRPARRSLAAQVAAPVRKGSLPSRSPEPTSFARRARPTPEGFSRRRLAARHPEPAFSEAPAPQPQRSSSSCSSPRHRHRLGMLR